MQHAERCSERFPTDVATALHHYDSISVDLGNRFRTSVDDTITAVLARPLSYGFIRKPFRAAMLKTFPHVVIFVETESAILFTGLVHSASNPDDWFNSSGSQNNG